MIGCDCGAVVDLRELGGLALAAKVLTAFDKAHQKSGCRPRVLSRETADAIRSTVRQQLLPIGQPG